MAIFVISDLHLSTNASTNKSMEVFGNRWRDYMNRIKKNWNHLVSEDDTVIVNGDISWAMTLEEAYDDFNFLNSLNGTKIISKGNHDYWWSTATKIENFLTKNGFSKIKLLHNNAHIIENTIICGSRGWYINENLNGAPKNSDYDKIVSREAVRIRHSITEGEALDGGRGLEKLLFLHFPPIFGDFNCEEIVSVLKEYGIKNCYFGHIHGVYDVPGRFEVDDITYTMTSADFLNFTPLFIKKGD